MKIKVIKLMTFILAIFFVFQVCAVADGEEKIGASVSYLVENSEITVSATVRGNTLITVIPSGINQDSINDENIPTVFRTLTAYGRFSDTFVMPDDAAGGKYTVYVTTSYGEDSAEFVYINLEEAEDTVKEPESEGESYPDPFEEIGRAHV